MVPRQSTRVDDIRQAGDDGAIVPLAARYHLSGLTLGEDIAVRLRQLPAQVLDLGL